MPRQTQVTAVFIALSVFGSCVVAWYYREDVQAKEEHYDRTASIRSSAQLVANDLARGNTSLDDLVELFSDCLAWQKTAGKNHAEWRSSHGVTGRYRFSANEEWGEGLYDRHEILLHLAPFEEYLDGAFNEVSVEITIFIQDATVSTVSAHAIGRLDESALARPTSNGYLTLGGTVFYSSDKAEWKPFILSGPVGASHTSGVTMTAGPARALPLQIEFRKARISELAALLTSPMTRSVQT